MPGCAVGAGGWGGVLFMTRAIISLSPEQFFTIATESSRRGR
jgi:hypothetical protein